MDEICIFCNYNEFQNRSIFESKFFYFILDKHQVNNYHFLLVSKKHVTALGYLDDEEIYEADKIIKNLQANNEFVNKYTIAFERGNKYENKSSNFSIDHTHIHLFILPQSLFDKLTFGKYVKDMSLFDLKDYIKRQSYFVFWEVRNSHWRIGHSNDFPSQKIRQFIAEETALNENWDWKFEDSLKMNFVVQSQVIELLSNDSNFKPYSFG